MTKKHFEAIAAMFSRELAMGPTLCCKNTIEAIAERMADIFAADNPRFDRERFLVACGVG